MKLSVFYDHILQAESQSGKPIEELLSGVRAAGIEAVEIRLEYLLEHEDTMELFKRTGLGLSCIYEFYDMDIRDELEKIHKHIETAAHVHTDKVLVVPGFLSKEEAEEMQALLGNYEQLADYFNHNTKIQGMAKGLRDCVRIGQEAGITVTVEDFDDIKSPLSCMNGVRWFLENIRWTWVTLFIKGKMFWRHGSFSKIKFRMCIVKTEEKTSHLLQPEKAVFLLHCLLKS